MYMSLDGTCPNSCESAAMMKLAARHRHAPSLQVAAKRTSRARHPRGASRLRASAGADAALTDQEVQRVTQQWLDGFIVGMNICPFAAAAMRQTNLVVCRASSDHEFDAEIAAEMDRLFTDYDTEAATTLFILASPMATEFEQLMQLQERACGLLADRNLRLQVVPFHPLAEFSDFEQDPSEFVSRSPFPVLHLLRQADVDSAERGWVNLGRLPGDIPEANSSLLRGLGWSALQRMWTERSW